MSKTYGLEFKSEEIPSDPERLRDLQDKIEERLNAARIPDAIQFDIKLALHEAVVNAMKHGNQYDKNKTVLVEYSINDHAVAVRVKDQGEGFDPADVPDPTAIENLERGSGRGLLMMRHYMTGIAYSERGNAVAMLKVVSEMRQSEEEIQELLGLILQGVDDVQVVDT